MEKTIHFEETPSPDPRGGKDVEQIAQTVGVFGKPIRLLWPTDFVVVTQTFAANPDLYLQRNLPGHEGLDIRAPLGSKVYACADGVVEAVHQDLEEGNPYGRYLTIAHADGYGTLYGHLGSIAVAKGQRVKAGSLIGTAGPTGQTGGGHIHLGLTQQGATARGLTHFPGDVIDPTPFLSFAGRTRDVSNYPWPAGRCLAGAHARGVELGFDASGKYVPEAALLQMDASRETIASIRKSNASLFLMTQLQLPATGKAIAAAEWAAWARPSIQRHVESGVAYFAVLRAPNLTSQGCGLHWASGREFARWWLDAVAQLKTFFPSAKFGFPGLSCGPHITGQRLDAIAFMEGADEAMLHADWIGALCNWSRPMETLEENSGAAYALLRRYYPDQLIFITEFGSTDLNPDPTTRANEAARYFDNVKNLAGIGAAFARN